MKLTRITKLRRYRVFRDFSWPSDLHTFGQFNLIYGWNGCGKTTLSSLLVHVQRRAALSEGEAELEFDGTSKVAGTAFSSTALPEVRVFNRDFINVTLQSAGSDITPIYFLGEDSIEKQAQVERYKKDRALAEEEVKKAKSEKKTADSKLDEFCIAKAKLIKELLTTANSAGYNNYDKRRFKQAVEKLTAKAAEMALLSDEVKVSLRSQKDAQPKAVIEKVAAPSIDLEMLAADVEQLVGRSVVTQTLNELTKDADVGGWVQRGLSLHSGARYSETCRFCQQPLTIARRAAIEAHFNDAFAAFQRDLDVLAGRLESTKQRLVSLWRPEPTRFYDHLFDDARAAVDGLVKSANAVIATLDALIERVKAKRANPFSSVTPPIRTPEVVDVADALTAINTLVDKHNATTENFRRSVEEACRKLEGAYIAETHDEFAQLSDAAERADNEWKEANGKPKEIQEQIDGLERQIIEHRRPAEELTKELCAYLGRDELRFDVKETGYALTRGGQFVSNLSEGERTAIAFLYFLKSLQDKTFDLVNGIVVIDDPVSSLDANALFYAFAYMKERTKQCGQLIILTHNFSFFRLVKNWFHYLPGQRKTNVDLRPGRFFFLRPCKHVDGSRTAQLSPLDRLLEEHESEYQYLFKRVYDEAHRAGVDSLEHHYGLPNIARRLVESFLAFRFPDASGDLSPRLERVEFDSSKKTRILRLLNTYSHAGAVGEPEHDLSLLAEVQPVLQDVLEMMKVVDPDHYEGLIKLVMPG